MTKIVAETPTCWAHIYIAGDYVRAREACREWCERGACVSLWRADYIYTGGEEAGLVVNLINYPRFPSDQKTLTDRALELARHLIVALHQHSATVETSEKTYWLSRRPEHIAA